LKPEVEKLETAFWKEIDDWKKANAEPDSESAIYETWEKDSESFFA
jgi:hypothetical protein